MMRKIAFALVVMVVCFSVLYYVDGKDYLSGKEKHYIGTSTISADELVILADTRNVLPSYSVTEIKKQDYGKVEITYDFYSEDNFSFLTVAPFSVLDTNIINVLYGARKQWAILGVIAIGFIVGLKFYNLYIASAGNFVRIKVENVMWYILHPHQWFIRKEAPRLFTAIIEQDVNVQPESSGIIGVRTWKYKNGYLFSSGFGQSRWENKVLLANKIPTTANENGVYACRLGVINAEWVFLQHIIGIVSLTGEWLEHADGVVRAESCEILAIIISHYHKPVADVISSTYGVPVVVAENPINKYLAWVAGDNGIACLKHNGRILKGEADGIN